MGDIKKAVLVANALIFSVCQIITAQSTASYYAVSLYTNEQIARMIQSGAVKNDTLIWKQGMEYWAAAETIAELQALFTPAGGGPEIVPETYALLKGPFTAAALIEMVRSGALTKSSLIWAQGMEDWMPVPAGMIPALQPVFRDEKVPISTPVKNLQFGVGIEGNGYSLNGAAAGAALSVCISFIPALSAGMRIGYFNNFDGLLTMEAGGLLRGSINLKDVTLFVQGEGGFAMFMENTEENTETAHSYFAGGKLGVLIPLNKVKLGPYIGGGFPYLFACGILFAF
ncbi:DUF4339 domain-containing protein [Breznakiellaceae bacterium SP9]